VVNTTSPNAASSGAGVVPAYQVPSSRRTNAGRPLIGPPRASLRYRTSLLWRRGSARLGRGRLGLLPQREGARRDRGLLLLLLQDLLDVGGAEAAVGGHHRQDEREEEEDPSRPP